MIFFIKNKQTYIQKDYFAPSWVPDKKIDTILSTVRAVTRKRRAELAHR